MPLQKFKYKAFISYSHLDKKWGDWLHKGLETYRIPKTLVGKRTEAGVVPKRLFPIFRDREELPSSNELGKVIDQALRDYSYLVIICSPRSAESQWVNEEIKQFKRLGKSDNILCLIVDGEPNVAAKTDRFQEECFPEAVKYEISEEGELSTIPTEPIAADAREGKDGKHNALLKLIAGLLGVGFDDLKKRDVARKQKRLAVLSGFSFILVAIMAVLTFWAFEQQRVADRQRLEAEKERTEAQRQLIKANAVSSFMKDFFTSLQPGALESVRQEEADFMKAVLDKGLLKIDQLNEEPEIEMDLRHILGVIYSSLSLHTDALTQFKKALTMRLEILGPEHPNVATSYFNVAVAYRNKREAYLAANFFESALAIQLKTLGPSHPDVAKTYGNLGVLHSEGVSYSSKRTWSHYEMAHDWIQMSDEKHYQKALVYYDKCSEIELKVFGPEHPCVASTYENVGNVHYFLKNYDEAIGNYEKALAINLKTLTPVHPWVAKTYFRIGLIFSIKEDYDEALVYFAKSFTTYLNTKVAKNDFKNDFVSVSSNYANLRYSYWYSPERHIYEALRLPFVINSAEKIESEHPDAALVMLNAGLAIAVDDLFCGSREGFFDEHEISRYAFEYSEKALSIQLEALGKEHPDLAKTYFRLGDLHDANNDYEKALNYYKKSKEIHWKISRILFREEWNTKPGLRDRGVVAFTIDPLKKEIELRPDLDELLSKIELMEERLNQPKPLRETEGFRLIQELIPREVGIPSYDQQE